MKILLDFVERTQERLESFKLSFPEIYFNYVGLSIVFLLLSLFILSFRYLFSSSVSSPVANGNNTTVRIVNRHTKTKNTVVMETSDSSETESYELLPRAGDGGVESQINDTKSDAGKTRLKDSAMMIT